MLLRTLTLLLTLSFTIPLSASADALTSTDPFSVAVSPTYPTPFGQAVLTPTSGSTDLSNSVMTILVNGKSVYEGTARSVTIPLGAAGVLVPITVMVKANGVTSTKTLSIRPQDVAIVAEPVSTAPVLYPGKPLVPLDGSVRVVAIATLRDTKGSVLDPATLSYSWVVENTRVIEASGIGRDTLLVAAPLQYRSRDVSVSVQSQDGSVSGGASLSLESQDPVVRLYENDPLLGILYDHALGDSYSIASAEKTLYGAAYSFSLAEGAPLLRWFLNGTAAQTGPSITLKPTGSGSGTASLSLVSSAGDSTTATANLSLSFGAAKGGLGIFGL